MALRLQAWCRRTHALGVSCRLTGICTNTGGLSLGAMTSGAFCAGLLVYRQLDLELKTSLLVSAE